MVARTPLEELRRKMSRDASEKMILRPWEQEHQGRISEQINIHVKVINAGFGDWHISVLQRCSAAWLLITGSLHSLQRDSEVNPDAPWGYLPSLFCFCCFLVNVGEGGIRNNTMDTCSSSLGLAMWKSERRGGNKDGVIFNECHWSQSLSLWNLLDAIR